MVLVCRAVVQTGAADELPIVSAVAREVVAVLRTIVASPRREKVGGARRLQTVRHRRGGGAGRHCPTRSQHLQQGIVAREGVHIASTDDSWVSAFRTGNLLRWKLDAKHQPL